MGSKLFTIITSLCFTTILLAEDITEKEYIHVKYMESLVKKANEKKLYEKEYWRIIVHYEKNWAFITESQVDDPNFFMSPEGKHNPQAELDATIRGFFLAPDEVKERRDHPLERFPLRFKWLCKELNIDKTKTAYDHPKIIQDFIDDYEPDYIKLVFPSAYINSPASMFGHTLIIIKSKKKRDY